MSQPYHSYGDITSPSRPLDRDKLYMVPRRRAADTAHQALFPIQNDSPEVMLAGVAVLFAAFCTRCRQDPEDMFRMGLRILRDPDVEGGDRGSNASLQSLKDFAGIRIMGERHVSIA